MDDEFDSLLSDIGSDSDEPDTPALDALKKDVKILDTVKDDIGELSKRALMAETETTISASNIPKIVGEDIPAEYNEIVKGLQFEYYCLPKLDYDEIYSELSDLSIQSSPSPTLQMINDEIQKIQASKDRLDEILKNIDRNYYFKKAAVDLLSSAYYKYSNEKSADKRKGDVMIKTSNFIIDLAKTEACFRVCNQILNNLNSSHESLSRRITVNQQLLKMNDYGRGQLPDYDFSRKRSTATDNDNENDPESNSNELEEMTF